MHDPTAGAEILLQAHELITRDRQNTYSHPLDDYSRTVSIYNALKGEDMMTAEDGVLFMVCVKLSRLMHELDNNLELPDNTVDAIGYLGCLQMIREASKQQTEAIARFFKTGEPEG